MLWKDLKRRDKVIICLCCIIFMALGLMIGGIIHSLTTNQKTIDAAETTVTDFAPAKIAPFMTYFGEANDQWNYYVDERTNVVYMARSRYYGFGITPAYNADGSLMTRDQLINEQE